MQPTSWPSRAMNEHAVTRRHSGACRPSWCVLVQNCSSDWIAVALAPNTALHTQWEAAAPPGPHARDAKRAGCQAGTMRRPCQAGEPESRHSVSRQSLTWVKVAAAMATMHQHAPSDSSDGVRHLQPLSGLRSVHVPAQAKAKARYSLIPPPRAPPPACLFSSDHTKTCCSCSSSAHTPHTN